MNLRGFTSIYIDLRKCITGFTFGEWAIQFQVRVTISILLHWRNIFLTNLFVLRLESCSQVWQYQLYERNIFGNKPAERADLNEAWTKVRDKSEIELVKFSNGLELTSEPCLLKNVFESKVLSSGK